MTAFNFFNFLFIFVAPHTGSNGSAWVKHRVKDKYDYYYSLQSSEGTWDEPEGFIQNNTQLTKEEIQVWEILKWIQLILVWRCIHRFCWAFKKYNINLSTCNVSYIHIKVK